MSNQAWQICFDASALIKRYSFEAGTDLLNEVFRLSPAEWLSCSTLTILEVASILARKRNDQRLTPDQFQQAMTNFKQEVLESDTFSAIPVNDSLLRSSLELTLERNINAADAVVLRSALNVRDALRPSGADLMLWASDRRLVRAAMAEGLTVFNPEKDTIDRLRELLGA